MSISKGQESVVTGMYAFARRSGFLDTGFGQWLFQHAYFTYKRHLEDPYAALLRRYPKLLEGGNVLDVGANIGYTSRLFSRYVDPEFKVYAFEPDEFNFRLLTRVQGKISRLQVAVGESDGTAELWINPKHHGDHRVVTGAVRPEGQTARVPLVAIDTFVAKQAAPFPVRFIKVDVQGYEMAVCRGMERTLAENPQAILALEYMPEAMRDLGFDPRALVDWITAREFSVHVIRRDGTLEAVSVETLATSRYLDLLATSKSCAAGW